MARLLNSLYLPLICGLLFLQGCSAIIHDRPGVHLRLDEVNLSIAQARVVASSLATDIASRAGVPAGRVYLDESKYNPSVTVGLQDDRGYSIEVTIYPNDRLVTLEVRNLRFHPETNERIAAHEKELAEVARKVIESDFPGHVMRYWVPQTGAMGP
jgi:hypothetical protein